MRRSPRPRECVEPRLGAARCSGSSSSSAHRMLLARPSWPRSSLQTAWARGVCGYKPQRTVARRTWLARVLVQGSAPSRRTLARAGIACIPLIAPATRAMEKEWHRVRARGGEASTRCRLPPSEFHASTKRTKNPDSEQSHLSVSKEWRTHLQSEKRQSTTRCVWTQPKERHRDAANASGQARRLRIPAR